MYRRLLVPVDRSCRLNGTAEHGHDHHDHGHERTTDGMNVRASG
jgi:hypothetical protein